MSTITGYFKFSDVIAVFLYIQLTWSEVTSDLHVSQSDCATCPIS